MSTPITAEAIFDTHAIALGLPSLGDGRFTDYVDEAPKSAEGRRCLTEAFAAAALAQHADVHRWLAQARERFGHDFVKK